jgi:hypothetical protein
MNVQRRQALLADLHKLKAEIPDLIQGVVDGDPVVTSDALALVQGAGRERFEVAMKRLTKYVLDEADKGNDEPLRLVASGEAFD